MLEAFVQKTSSQDPRQVAIREAFDSLCYQAFHAMYYDRKELKDLPFGKTVFEASLPEQREWLLALMVWLEKFRQETSPQKTRYFSSELRDLCFTLLKRKLPFTSSDMILMSDWMMATLNPYKGMGGASINKACETYFKANPAPHDPALIAALQKIADRFNSQTDPDTLYYGRKLAEQLYKVAPPAGPRLIPSPLSHADAWAASAQSEIAALEPESANAWNTLLTTCAQAKAGAPTAKWLLQAHAEQEIVGVSIVRAALLRWFLLVDTPHIVTDAELAATPARYRELEGEMRRWSMAPINGDILKGLVWLLADQDDAEMARALSRLIKDSFRKIPGVGARLARVGNAGLWALGQMPGMHGVAQLAILKTRLKLPIIQKQIAAAFDATAKRLNLAQSEIEELVVPTYGLGENGQAVGVRVETFDGYRAEISMVENEPTLRWYKAESDKPLSAAPQAVKAAHPDEVKDLTQTVKDMRGMLTAQKDRIDGLFLAQKSWPYWLWRERYLDHPLVGLIARRLIWTFRHGERAASAIWLDGNLVANDDQPVTWLDDGTLVELWHPLSAHVDVVQGWRRWLDVHQVQQPFKQAHREIYLLTDAERNTNNYSNRFAAHIIKQHQFSALCAARGWKHQLRLMVDDVYPAPSRTLPNWDLRAEYWVESIGNNFGEDTTDSGTFLYLSTDQVRFYPLAARQNFAHASGGGYGFRGRNTNDPLPLEDIPPLVFSELMRDVDLFVGVASVANDPNWFDGGPGGRHIDYWHQYSFGNLNESAKTRRQVLEVLLPRLKIASRCQLDEHFLIVRGDLRTYKIHLGSGNILMEPNDQYLCIVPKSAFNVEKERILLPFEGDQTLSVIISKAFLLANDKAIKDPSITRQIGK